METQHRSQLRVLVLGGTTEATALASRLAEDARFAGLLSLAGRTANPAASALPVRVGGFGGAEGLARFIASHPIDIVIDATHPFAAQISANAIAACRTVNCPLIALERPPWQPEACDRWQTFPTVAAAITGLPAEPARVFSGLGRLSLDELLQAPQHHYIVRVIDPPSQPLKLPNVTTIAARGPFRTGDDIALFQEHRVDIVLAKNAGGTAAVAKIAAARALGLRVMMIDRPHIPERPTFGTVDEVWQELTRHVAAPTERGV